ncbi:response regulator [Lachnospiraceae bacterium ZAX-1]
MKQKIWIGFLFAILCLLMIRDTANAKEDGKSFRIAMDEEDNLVVDNLLRELMGRVGYDVSLTRLDGISAIVATDVGQYDILSNQIDDIAGKYENLFMVPEVFGEVTYCVYAKNETQIKVSNWNSLEGLSVGIEHQRPYLQEKLGMVENVRTKEYQNKTELLEAVSQGDIKAAIIPSIFQTSIYYPQNVVFKGVIETKDSYLYVNKKYRTLVPSLASEYKKMKETGVVDEIKKNQNTANDGKKLILHIMSYGPENQAEGDLNNGIRNSLLEYQNAQLYTISLNSNLRENQEARMKMYGDMLCNDFGTRSPDVIIASDSYALDFLKEYYFKLFEGIPILYIGVAGIKYEGFGDNFLFLEKKIDVKETVEKVKELFPDTKELFVINDTLKDGEVWKKIIKEELATYQGQFKIRHSGNLSFRRLLQEIAKLPKDAVILSGTYYGEPTEKYDTGKEMQAKFKEAYKVPVFSWNTTGFLEGELGGKYIDNHVIATYAGDLAMELANGKKPAQIVVDDTKLENKWYFDKEMMDKWNISITDLNEKDVILFNRPTSFKENNPEAYYLTMLLIAGSLTTIAILLVLMKKAKNRNRKLVEMQKHLVDAEEVNQLKNRFIINMSHEIRTPMNAIIGLSDIEILKDHSWQIREPFIKINHAAKILLSLINDILDFSKIESNKMGVEEEAFLLEELMAEVMDTTSQRLLDKRVEMLLGVDNKVPNVLYGDKAKLWQILKSILDNSVKFTQVGKIIVKISVQKEEPERKTIMIIIEDTGKGMSAENLKNLFVPFEQFDDDGSKSAGTGLGMSLAKELVELIGGNIAVESEPGIGTKTTLMIPFTVKNEMDTIVSKSDHAILRNKKALIVDDNYVACQVMDALLKYAGVETTIIQEADKVMPMLKEYSEQGKKFDLILMDYLLDKGTGVALGKELANYAINDTKLLMVSAYAKLQLRKIAKEDIFDGIIDKPFVPSEFYAKICDAIEGNKMNQEKEDQKYYFPNARVLVCEDNLINQEVIIGILELYSIIPEIANNGQEGIDMLEKQEFDLVIMDILMPVMDGHTATKAIRNLKASYKDIPIVAMTANVLKSEQDLCLEEGMNGYITKPVDLEELYQELLNWLPPKIVENATGGDLNKAECEIGKLEESEEYMQLNRLGIDVKSGIKQFGGKVGTYKKTLKNMLKDIVDNGLLDIDEMTKEENNEEFKHYIHSLKGATGNLSMVNIHNQIKKFEESVQSGKPDVRAYWQLSNVFLDRATKILLVLQEQEDNGSGG